MKIGIIQISDIHYDINKENLLIKSFDSIKLAINMLYSDYIKDLEKCLILINGDVVNSGNDEMSYNKFFDMLSSFCNEMNKTHNNKFIAFVIAGNHDCDCAKLNFENFYMFQNKVLNLIDPKYVTKINNDYYLLSFGNIDFFAINSSSVFPNLQLNNSFTKYVDKGEVNIDTTIIKHQLGMKTSNYRILAMHHPIDYCEDGNQKEIEDICKNYFNLVLCAHKHYGENKTEFSNQYKKYSIIQSGALICDDDKNVTLNSSSFIVLLIESKEDCINVQFDKFEYSDKDDIYVKSKEENDCFNDKLKLYTKMPLSVDFRKQFEVNPYFGNEHKLFDYFTFQSLISNDNNEKRNKITSLNELNKFLMENKKIYIEGQRHSGKTTLAKKIFEFYRLEKQKFPLYISLNEYSKKDIKNCVNLSIGSIYGKGNTEYYQLSNVQSRILIFDNVSYENYSIFANILEESKNYFEYVIVFYGNNLTASKESLFLFEPKYCYKICGFYGEERNNLINNIIKYDGVGDSEKRMIINRIKSIIKNNSHYIFRDPLFLVIFIKYIIKNYKRYTNEIRFDEIYTEIMKEHICNVLAFESDGKIDINKAIEVLPIIANSLFVKNKTCISYSQCIDVINIYLDNTYGARVVKATEIIELLINSTLLISDEDNLFFNNDRFFAFFLAQYLLINDSFESIRDLFNIPTGVILDVLDNIVLIKKESKYSNRIIEEMIIENLYNCDDNNRIILLQQNDSNISLPIPKYKNLDDARKAAEKTNTIVDNEIDESLINYNSDILVQKEIIPKVCDQYLKYNNILMLLSRFIGSAKMLTDTDDKRAIIRKLYDQIQLLSGRLFNKIINSEECRKYICDNKISGEIIEVFKCLIYYAFIECTVSNAYNYDLKSVLLDFDFNTTETKLIKLSVAILSDESELVTNLAIDLFSKSNSKGVKLIVSVLIWRYIGDTINLTEKNFDKLNNELFSGSIDKNSFLNQKFKNLNV